MASSTIAAKSCRSGWSAAASDLQKLLAQGEPLADIAPKIVTCLLNAHEDLLPHDAATIEDLLRRLESAGHTTLTADLRLQLEAKQPQPRKPWWKFWERRCPRSASSQTR